MYEKPHVKMTCSIILVCFFVTEKKYLMLLLAMFVRSSVCPSSVEITLTRLHYWYIFLADCFQIRPRCRHWRHACLKEIWFRNSNCRWQIYATYDFLANKFVCTVFDGPTNPILLIIYIHVRYMMMHV